MPPYFTSFLCHSRPDQGSSVVAFVFFLSLCPAISWRISSTDQQVDVENGWRASVLLRKRSHSATANALHLADNPTATTDTIIPPFRSLDLLGRNRCRSNYRLLIPLRDGICGGTGTICGGTIPIRIAK